MQNLDHYSGIFLPSDSQFAGHLSVAGADSLLTLTGKRSWVSPKAEYVDIHGLLGDGRKASLLKCVLRSENQYRFDENAQFESRFFPNYVIVGEEFIRSEEPVIRAAHYHFENVASLLTGHRTFQSLHPDPVEVRKLLEENHKRYEKAADEHGWPKPPFETEIGTFPHLLYFSGVSEIVASDTGFGRVSLTNRTSHSMGTAAGIGIDNEVTANIEFTEPKALVAVIQALYTLHSLFEISLGRRQRYQWIELELTHRMKDHDLNERVRLYWSLCNDRVSDRSKPHLADILLAPDRRREEFSKVVAGWMDSAATMADARERFATAFFGPYSINRIVGAANMFDLLPEERAPKKRKTDAKLMEVVEHCRGLFKDLPESFAKQSILSTFGRVGTASLRDKVYHRANKVMEEAGDHFSGLHLPCNHAVLARNHYVHGSKASFNYKDHFTEFVFITDTIEFVFAASDLLDLGWDLLSWMREGSTMSHPFSAYVVNCEANMDRLNALVRR